MQDTTQALPAGFTTTLILPAEIGAPLQGGIYVGPSFDPETGKITHLIAGEYLPDTTFLGAKKAAAAYRDGDLAGWRAPTKAEATAAALHAGKHFKSGYHWTSTPCGSYYAWFVSFEGGYVSIGARYHGFRFRPFRSLTA